MTLDYVLTQHAADALDRRRILLSWMEQVFMSPEWTEADAIDGELEHRFGRISAFDGRVLRVIVNVHVKPPRIVTAYFDRGKTNP